MDKILLIDKPKGITSFDCIRKLRKILSIKKMGHAGTLDPLATGLLIVGVGKYTKRLSSFIGYDKTYQAEIILGIETDTKDIDGTLINAHPVVKISKRSIVHALKKCEGEHFLKVPKYSAVKYKGKPLYWYARNNIKVPLVRKKMKVFSAQYHKHYTTNITFPEKKSLNTTLVVCTFHVSSGTYIRSIAELLGANLNTKACVANLRRTKIGPFTIRDARKLDDIY